MTESTLKKLHRERGILSRRIGEAKKNGEPVDELIARVRALTARIESESLPADGNKAPAGSKGPKGSKPSNDSARPPASTQGPGHLSSTHLVEGSACSVCELKQGADAGFEWNRFVAAHPASSAYHQGDFLAVVESVFGHKIHRLVARDTQDRWVGVLPLVEMKSRLFGHLLISIPFFNYGGAVATSAEAFLALSEHATRLGGDLNADLVELRNVVSEPLVAARTDKVTMLLRLPSAAESLWNGLSSKVRAQVRSAQRHEFEFKVGGVELVDNFYAVFSRNMRDLGTPVYSKEFFERMVAGCENVHVAVQYLAQRPVSAGVLVGWRETLEIPWASSVRSANGANANMSFYWSVLKFAIESGFHYFDFGRSSKTAGTFRFKKQWGATPIQLNWTHLHSRSTSTATSQSQAQAQPQAASAISPDNPKYRLAIRLWRLLPVPVANILGPRIVRSIP